MNAKTISISLNEEAEQKDIDRIKGLFARSKGDDAKLIQLTQNMANSITDREKAVRRAEAAEQVLGPEDNPLADIFYKRAEEIGGGITPTTKSTGEPRKVRTKSNPIDELPNNPEFDETTLPVKRWNEKEKYIGYIYLPTYSAIALYDWEITGQLSDGAWENTNPQEHWLFWNEVQPRLGKPQVVSNQRPIKNNYNLTSLIQYVGDRMVQYGRFGKAVGDRIFKIGSQVSNTVEDFPEEGPFNLAEFKKDMIAKHDWRAKDYYWEGLTQEDVDAYYAVQYNEKDMRKDLQYIKQAMKTLHSNTMGYKRGYYNR